MALTLDIPLTLRGVALDVDGVLTDGGFWWGANGEELKRFCFADVMGISLAKKAGLVVALISGEDSALVTRFANKLGITDVERGCKDKALAVTRFAQRHRLSLAEICFMGDDVNDLGALGLCGFAAAPADARAIVLDNVDFVTRNNGGNGAVRELIDLILCGTRRPSRHDRASVTTP